MGRERQVLIDTRLEETPWYCPNCGAKVTARIGWSRYISHCGWVMEIRLLYPSKGDE